MKSTLTVSRLSTLLFKEMRYEPQIQRGPLYQQMQLFDHSQYTQAPTVEPEQLSLFNAKEYRLPYHPVPKRSTEAG
jgi:hypothetical protein